MSTPARTSAPAARPSALEQAGVSVRRYGAGSLELREVTGVALARLQSLAPDADLAARMAQCDLPLPLEVNRCAGRDPATLCLAPGQWLLCSEFLNYERLSAQVAPALDLNDTVLLDLSAAFATFRVAGEAAPWLVQKLCGLDVFRSIAAGPHCARTRLDHAAVIVHWHAPGTGGDALVFDLLADRSLARWLWQTLLTSAPHAEELFFEYGIPV